MKRTALSSIDFCVLKYMPQGSNLPSPLPEGILIFLVRDQPDILRLLVAPDWRELVHASDLPYLVDLLKDFQTRAGLDANALLKQASSLSVGPLVTHSTGRNLADFPDLAALSRSFLDF